MKLLYALIAIFVIVLVLFSVTRDILRDVNNSENKATKTPIDYLEEEYEPSNIVTNPINSNDINTLINKLESAGIYAFTNRALDQNYFSETQTYPANTEFSLKDYEVGAFFNVYLSAGRDNEPSVLSIKELSIRGIAGAEDKFKLKVVLELNLENILNVQLSSSNNLKRTYISTTCEIVIQNRKLNFLNGSSVQINELDEEKNNAVIDFINTSASTEDNSFRIEKFVPRYLCDFINEFLVKSNTELEIAVGQLNFNF